MPDKLRPDICIIGAGTAGMQAALQAAAFGVRPVLVDVGGDPAARGHNGARMGSDALRAGRLPLASLIAAARRAHAVAQSGAFGVRAGAVEIDFDRVRRYVHGVIAARTPNLARERLAALGVRVIEGAARFQDRATLVVGEVEIAARRFIIATGSTSALPPIAGLDAAPHLTTETVFDLTTCPAHLVVIGAGAAGLEFAQAFRRLGAKVTVLDAQGPLPPEDPECAAVLLDQLAREGVEMRVGTIARVEEAPPHSKWKVQVRLAGEGGEEVIVASHLLVADERWANVVGLGLDAAGVKYDEHGVVVDAGSRPATGASTLSAMSRAARCLRMRRTIRRDSSFATRCSGSGSDSMRRRSRG